MDSLWRPFIIPYNGIGKISNKSFKVIDKIGFLQKMIIGSEINKPQNNVAMGCKTLSVFDGGYLPAQYKCPFFVIVVQSVLSSGMLNQPITKHNIKIVLFLVLLYTN